MFIKQAPVGMEFYLIDGRILKNLSELSLAFQDMDDDVFWHHVNDELNKNDFAAWINDVLEDKKLASELKNVRDKTLYSQIIFQRLSN